MDSEADTESADFPESIRHQNLGFFATVSDGFGWSVRKTIFTYLVAVFKRHCVTATAGRCHCLIGGHRRWEGWGEQWSLEWWAASSAMLSTSHWQRQRGICPTCTICPTCMVHVAQQTQ